MDTNKGLVEHLFRNEYGKLVSVLTGYFGPAYIQLAEDIVQDTLIAALEHWGKEGVPTNPTGWLIQVAKRKGLNELKRNQMILKNQDRLKPYQTADENPAVFLENEIADSQLRMIFTCCHPSLNTASQTSLTLKTLCGFGVKEVASAFLVSESTIEKRLYRARNTIRESKAEFQIPSGKELKNRLENVALTLYLMFNEGYNSSTGDTVIRKDICLEAIRLGKLLVDHFPEYTKLNALIALFCFHTARFDARIDDHGAIVLFQDQDRSRWNQELIQIGMSYFKNSIGGNELSGYHIEANIAATHCLAKSFETTNWQVIYDQYMLLSKLKPNPIIRLNLAIVQSQISSPEKALELLKELESDKTLQGYALLFATQGALFVKIGRYNEAIKYFTKAGKLTSSNSEKAFIQKQLKSCKEHLAD